MTNRTYYPSRVVQDDRPEDRVAVDREDGLIYQIVHIDPNDGIHARLDQIEKMLKNIAVR